MSVDDRLRGALRDQADAFVPQVEEALDRARRRGRLERWRRTTVAVVATAAAVAAVAGAVVALGGSPQQEDAPLVDRPNAPESGTGTPQAPLRGTITAEVDRPDALAGRWTLQLNGNGSIDASPPVGFRGRVTGPAFTADGSTFRTTLFGNDLCAVDGSGIYTWLRIGDQIDFRSLSDTCDARERFFADSTWTMSTATAARD